MLLARHFLRKFNEQQNLAINGFTPEAASAIESYQWLGNIRELENKLKRAVVMCDDKSITLDDIGLDTGEELSLNLRQVRQEAEERAIKHAMALSDYNISASAKLLGVTRPTLYDLMKKYNVQDRAE